VRMWWRALISGAGGNDAGLHHAFSLPMSISPAKIPGDGATNTGTGVVILRVRGLIRTICGWPRLAFLGFGAKVMESTRYGCGWPCSAVERRGMPPHGGRVVVVSI